MVKNSFKEKPLKEALKDLGVKCDTVNDMILPSEGDQTILVGKGEGGEKKEKLNFEKFQEKVERLFSEIFISKNGIFLGDYEVILGKNKKDVVRYSSYIAVWIKKLNKTIFINDRAGESTFVCDKIISKEEMTTKSKKKFSEELGEHFHSIPYSEDKKDKWSLDMIDLICGFEKGSRKFIRDCFVDENGELTEKGKERFELNTTISRPKFKLENGMGYVAIARIFGFKGEQKDLFKDNIFYELSKAIFGEENENVKKLKEKFEKSR